MKKKEKKSLIRKHIYNYAVTQNEIHITFADGTIVKKTYSIEVERVLLKKMQNQIQELQIAQEEQNKIQADLKQDIGLWCLLTLTNVCALLEGVSNLPELNMGLLCFGTINLGFKTVKMLKSKKRMKEINGILEENNHCLKNAKEEQRTSSLEKQPVWDEKLAKVKESEITYDYSVEEKQSFILGRKLKPKKLK